MLFSLFI